MDSHLKRTQHSHLSITEKLIETLKIPRTSDCEKCFGIGFYADSSHVSRLGKRIGHNQVRIKEKNFSSFHLCSCVSRLCGRDACTLPYERYDSSRAALGFCECRLPRLALERITHLEKRSNIPDRYRACFLDNISLEHSSDSSLILAIDYIEEIISNFHETAVLKGLYIYGSTGCGKTLLACSLLNEIIRFYQSPVRYAKMSRDVLNRLRYSFSPSSENYGESAQIQRELSQVPLLVLDDVGSYQESSWVQEVIYDLVDARYENKLITVFTSNEPMSFWMDKAGGRIYSRLKEMCREICIRGPDYRVEVLS